MDSAPHVYMANRQQWHDWLVDRHDKETAIWLVYDKGPGRTMAWQDIVEEALCFGWIDSRPGKVSDTQSKLYLSRRKPKSVWSKINRESVERLTRQGLMQPAGIAAVEIAKQNGAWQALELSDNLIYPQQLVELLDADPQAKANLAAFPTGSIRNSLQWIYDAKTDQTRTNRIKQLVEAAHQNKRLR